MLKKLVAGTLVVGFALTGGLGVASAEEVTICAKDVLLEIDY